MLRERVSDNVYWFQSEIYAQVTAGVIAGPQWVVVIDTLALPEETLVIREFIETELRMPVRYVINTHYHADHCWGNYLFPDAMVVGHSLSRKEMLTSGCKALEAARLNKQNNVYRNVHIIPPQLTFDQGTLTLKVGKKNLILMPMGGHSHDGIAILVEEDRVLFAGDSFMPMPYIVDGDLDDTVVSIKRIGKMGLENIIQGHGDIILRGEIESAVKENLAYLANIKKAARKAARRRNPFERLDEVSVESCGKSRVLLGGLAEDLHRGNMKALIRQMTADHTRTSKVIPNDVRIL
ncbi:MAG: MBL fold metallo-hydrolase [Anaerolineaceae bacterium]|nr:MBL fold metallo-hydrolase [Anaerolineaceae bacterium]MBN2676818.1 MBL fold metallo-hydrolase [Anaerolineaceae bacterium]